MFSDILTREKFKHSSYTNLFKYHVVNHPLFSSADERSTKCRSVYVFSFLLFSALKYVSFKAAACYSYKPEY